MLPLCSFASCPALLAATSQAGEATYEFSRLEALDDTSLKWALFVCVLAVLLLYTWLIYRRESRTVSPAKATGLALLRTIAIGGLVVFFLGYEKRSSTEVVEPSRVALLVDTSLSMNLADKQGSEATRLAAARQLVAESDLVDELRKHHDVEVVAFGAASKPIAYYPQKANVEQETTVDNENPPTTQSEAVVATERANDLLNGLVPTELETRIGDAVADALRRYRGLPLAGLVVLSDGGQNRGVELRAASDAATAANATIHSVGFGPFVAPANLAVRELLAPERAYPGDKLTLQAVLHAQRLVGQQIDLQLFRRPIDESKSSAEPEGPSSAKWEPIDAKQVAIVSDDEFATARFETNPTDPGRFLYQVRATVSGREAQLDDNRQEAEIVVVDRETSVLLYAGGPSRDYRFLRNQLKRDDSFVVDVLLETGTEGISQDADSILFEFPTSAEQLSTYDAIVAFDPDFSSLSAEQVAWLEAWVANQSGGLIVVPGLVNTPRWVIDSGMKPIRGLYPVQLPSGMLDLSANDTASKKPTRLAFSSAGIEAEFLWLTDQRQSSEAAWQTFAGVFGGFSHNGPKPGATVLARLAGVSDDAPGAAYVVSQYYGGGQVLYLGSSELWRLRKQSPRFYERLWTSLLRHTSQGRLLQGSPRGKLLLPQDRYEVGATVQVRATMTNAQLQPIAADSLSVSVALPTGASQELVLRGDESRPGNFSGEIRVVPPGTYRLTLPVPESEDQLTRTIRVSSPQLEVGQTTRDEQSLRTLSETTGGHYYLSPTLALQGDDNVPAIVKSLPSQARSKRVIGSIDADFARQLALWQLAIIAGALCLEWMFRRLSYLA